LLNKKHTIATREKLIWLLFFSQIKDKEGNADPVQKGTVSIPGFNGGGGMSRLKQGKDIQNTESTICESP